MKCMKKPEKKKNKSKSFKNKAQTGNTITGGLTYNIQRFSYYYGSYRKIKILSDIHTIVKNGFFFTQYQEFNHNFKNILTKFFPSFVVFSQIFHPRPIDNYALRDQDVTIFYRITLDTVWRFFLKFPVYLTRWVFMTLERSINITILVIC